MNKLTELEINEVSLVDSGANPGANITLFKRNFPKKNRPQNQPQNQPQPKIFDTQPKNSDLQTQVVKNQTQVDELSTLLKSLTDKLNEHIDKAENVEFRKIAERYEILGTDADKLAPMLKSAANLNPQLYQTAIKVLDGALEAVKKSGVFDELGKVGTRKNSGDIQTFAAQIQKSQPNLSWRQALDAAYRQHPELQ